MIKISISGAVLAVLLLVSCVSSPVEITGNPTPAELIQRAQEASDKNHYNQSLQYYQAIIERFPDNIDAVCTAEYEIAFIHYKQKKYDDSKAEFNTLLARYDTPDEELLPQQFKRLAQIVLDRIEEIERKQLLKKGLTETDQV
jgi:outer membrane protein assembly factor BamD (BamD/ComL family)